MNARTRADAAAICLVMASTPDVDDDYLYVSESLGIRGGAAIALAVRAWVHVHDSVVEAVPSCAINAEAAQLLSEGWPG